MRHDKLTSLDERELNFRSGKCRPIDWCGYSGVDIDVGSDSNSHEWAHSTSVYLFIFACISIARAACFMVFFISGDKK